MNAPIGGQPARPEGQVGRIALLVVLAGVVLCGLAGTCLLVVTLFLPLLGVQ